MLTIIKNTFREALAKKIFIGYYIFYAIVVLFMVFLVNMDAVEGVMSLADEKAIVHQVETGFFLLSWNLIIFFSLISTASFIPSMLEKGTIDLLISKPISRPMILLSKYLGAVLFVFLSMVFLLGSIWLILSLKSAYWDFTFLLSILWLTFAFAVMYSIVVVTGLTTQSTVITILVNFFLIFVLCPILSIREAVVFSLVTNETVKFIFDFLYYILPKPGEIRDITNAMILNEPINVWKSSLNTETQTFTVSWMSAISSFIFCSAMMAYSIYYFSKKDY
ncbi:MAG: ABC transporter permease subunit [Chlorobi bacterium]|nr:ABC transporter permease subunit [Chlorobiota bacterium]MCI0715690.1 ABC transporter permease subunit [Chlorobiota bacterium]